MQEHTTDFHRPDSPFYIKQNPFDLLNKSIQLNQTRLLPPPLKILFFGGVISTSVEEKGGQSCRDALYHSDILRQHELFEYLLLAEDIYSFYKDSEYKDLLSFELDLAELSTLTVIIPESFGAAAELGAFSVLEEFEDKLLLVVQEKLASGQSFVWHGPIVKTKNRNSEAVTIYEWQTDELDRFIPESFADCSDLVHEIYEQARIPQKARKVNKQNERDVLFLTVGFLQLVSIADEKEIMSFFESLGFSLTKEKLLQKTQLLRHMGYIDFKLYQRKTFFIATAKGHSFVKFSFLMEAPIGDETRWINHFLEYYKKSESRADKQRIKALQSYLKSAAGE